MNAVSETSVTLIEKLSLVELPAGLRTTQLVVRYVEVDELNGSAVGEETVQNVDLNVSKMRAGLLETETGNMRAGPLETGNMRAGSLETGNAMSRFIGEN